MGTRQRSKTDRIACLWLIRRFIDTDPAGLGLLLIGIDVKVVQNTKFCLPGMENDRE